MFLTPPATRDAIRAPLIIVNTHFELNQRALPFRSEHDGRRCCERQQLIEAMWFDQTHIEAQGDMESFIDQHW